MQIDLKGHANTKRSKIKNIEKEREFFMCTVDEKKQNEFRRLLSLNAKRIFVSINAAGKNTT